MKYAEYYDARSEIVKILKEDLLGPLEENEIIESEAPVTYYLVGKLFPRNIQEVDEKGDFVDTEDVLEDDEDIAYGNSKYPSALGITFSITDSATAFRVSCLAGFYKEILGETIKWQRETISLCELISINELKVQRKLKYSVNGDLELQVFLHRKADGDKLFITATLVNNSYAIGYSYVDLSKATYFQPEIRIDHIMNGSFVSMGNSYANNIDSEVRELEMLYHAKEKYATGHGCSVTWSFDKNRNIESITSCVIPEYEVFQMKPAGGNGDRILSLHFLSTASLDEIRIELDKFLVTYEAWISEQEKQIHNLGEQFCESAHTNIAKCRLACSRIRQSVKLFDNPMIFKAFQFANEAMLRQRMGLYYSEETARNFNWYPFQLAFLLQEIESIVNGESDYRDSVDLLWFPTGGGKTEAYLGIAAFTIFLRRLRAISNSQEDLGVVVVMRYTLRLLSLQQFERAAAMVCAADLIRKRERLGTEPFDIGLWAGGALTPNTLADAEKALLKKETKTISNPVQLKICPWCGSKIDERHYHVEKKLQKLVIQCPNKMCDFHEGLPVHLIDESIYQYKPTFIMGTIDKFAQIAHKSQAGELLGVDLPNPPELIIQDELHLISGPLGTISGIYEAAIKKLCERNGVGPKVIASTATIRNAGSQILALYGNDYSQFPPQGISIDDSYFAKVATRDDRPARQYIGIMPAGTSKTIAFTRIMGCLLFASRYLEELNYSEEVIDSFWTETGYFNTLKDLGSALTKVIDSVQDRFLYLYKTKFASKYPFIPKDEKYDKLCELTSRNSSMELGEMIQNGLQIKFTKERIAKPYDFLLASNMISVGIDVARLGTMLVVGQPLKTTEYIQATSRVGRTTPGLVITLYTAQKSRDRSHYEDFMAYHATFYKFVEATSITPFSDRARDRALQALYVVLARYSIPCLRNNEDARKYTRTLEGLDDIKEYILNYVAQVDPDEVEGVREELYEIEQEWEDRASHSSELVYSAYAQGNDTLFQDEYLEGKRFRMMNSMRNVEPAIGVTTEE